MNRHLATCPYCNTCEIALDDHPELVFEGGAEPGSPCSHVTWIEARFLEFVKKEHGVQHLIGSLELGWESPHPNTELTEEFPSYLTQLVTRGSNWEFAPACDFQIANLSSDESPETGDSFSQVDGSAIFAQSPESFWDLAKSCCEEHLAALEFPLD